MTEITPQDLSGPAQPDTKPIASVKDVPEDIQKAIWQLALTLEQEDKDIRNRDLIKWRRNEDYWIGIQDGFYSALSQRYIAGATKGVTYPGYLLDDNEDIDEYDSTVNVYRAHGESIIAALSTGLPFTRFFPKNADDPDDISTSKAASKISEMIQKQNKSQWLFLHALYLLYTNPFVAARTYRHESAEYGMNKQPIYDQQPMYFKDQICEQCGNPISAPNMSNEPYPEDPAAQPQVPVDPALEEGPAQFNPIDPNITEAGMTPEMPPMPPEEPIDPMMTSVDQGPICPTCGPTSVSVEYYQEDVPSILGYNEVPKARECIEVYGALNIKVSHTARNFEQSPYLIFEDEVHYTYLRGLYPDMADQIDYFMSAEAIHRRTTQPDARGMATFSQAYIRPWAYNYYIKTDPATLEFLKTTFPKGVKVCYVNNLILSIEEVVLDDEWTLTKSPLSRYIHGPSLGDPGIPCQDMRNDLVYMTLDTVKHGVGDTFANPDVLDFDQYQKYKNQPGSVFPAKPRRGESLGDAFVSVKSATLSQEVKDFWAQLDQDAQFVLGDFPSLYGGQQQGGSKTLGEYVESQSRALQRLSTPWKMLSIWWASVMSKCVNSYLKHAMTDEYYVKANGDNFENVWIRTAEMQGQIGEVEPDISEQFPVTWSQRHAMFLEFIKENPLEPILATMFHPENTAQVSEILGLSNLYIPGQADRSKQLREIAQLLKSEPDVMSMMPSVMPDMDVDNHEVHMEAIKAWAISEVGMEAKTNNPKGYANIMFHYRMHQSMMQPMVSPEGGGEEEEVSEGGAEPPPENI